MPGPSPRLDNKVRPHIRFLEPHIRFLESLIRYIRRPISCKRPTSKRALTRRFHGYSHHEKEKNHTGPSPRLDNKVGREA
jgi:hypothetical protein